MLNLQWQNCQNQIIELMECCYCCKGFFRFVLTFSLGAGPVPGLLLSEILPSRIRAKAMAVCMSVHWVINFFVGLLFLNLLQMLGPQILYTIFGTFFD
ncbi:probable plastidic glucose transporter 2 [Salvia splendens]|uniref:probable plastidic glucose transporter 2 n=1 Tax=Salvia splendens TaxID=180675 RepID=UPI001C265B2A|nr:probable plastidic glucose transporter 2 [Salvia splendens]